MVALSADERVSSEAVSPAAAAAAAAAKCLSSRRRHSAVVDDISSADTQRLRMHSVW